MGLFCAVYLFSFLEGYARLSNVEFYRIGQYAHTDPNDPRVGLAFFNAVVDEAHPSIVRGCSFHHGYNMGVGVYDTDDLVLELNVVQGVSGPGDTWNGIIIFCLYVYYTLL